MRLSIVSTLYMSAPYLGEFHRRMSAAAARITPDYEIILVDDGSPDDSQRLALDLCAKDPRVTLVELSRNFGHHKAMMTGLAHANGDLVLLIDSDLEEEPELLQQFHDEMLARDADVVYGVQLARKGNWFERGSGALFYWMIDRMSSYPVPRNMLTARLMRRDYVQALIAHKDQALFLAGVWAVTGFRQVPLTVKKLSHSPTTYDLSRKVANLVNAITSFTTTPLVMIFYMGCLISLMAACAGTYLVIRVMFFGELLAGWASLIVSIWFLGGLTIFSLGVIGIYLSKVFIESKRRPYTIVRAIHGAAAAAKRGPRVLDAAG